MHIVNLICVFLSICFAYVALIFYKSIDGKVRIGLMTMFASLSWAFLLGAIIFETSDHTNLLNSSCFRVGVCLLALSPLVAAVIYTIKFISKKYPGSFLE